MALKKSQSYFNNNIHFSTFLSLLSKTNLSKGIKYINSKNFNLLKWTTLYRLVYG